MVPDSAGAHPTKWTERDTVFKKNLFNRIQLTKV